MGILMAFMLGNSVPRGPGVDLRWCPLSQRIGTTSCSLTGVTVRRSLFNSMRREVRFGHQRRGQVEWSLTNSKDPTLRRMIKVLTKATSGSDLLSFLKDRNWGTPGDRRRSPRWDRLRLQQQKTHAKGLEWSGIAEQSQNGGEDPLAQKATEHVTDKVGARLKMQRQDTLEVGSEMEMLGEGEGAVGTEMPNVSPTPQETGAKLSSEEESQEVSLMLEEETEMVDESDDQYEEEEISEEKLSSEEEGPEVPFSSEEGMEMSDGNDDQLEEEGTLENPPPLPSLAEEDQEQ